MRVFAAANQIAQLAQLMSSLSQSLPELPSLSRRRLDPSEMPAAGASSGLIMRFVPTCPGGTHAVVDWNGLRG